ncbi:MAG TPA: AbgT family transporter [Pseudonocardiaceae bacterium]|nr:AbgT family transporter [Pseudonocardiaceae bacterium]
MTTEAEIRLRLGMIDSRIIVVLLLLIAGIAMLNLLITSGTALWALLAPVIIPATQLIGVNPATVMAVYRIADSCTNSITPMSSTFILTVGYLQTMRKSAGIGTLVSFTLPAAMAMLLTWTALFGVWYALGNSTWPWITSSITDDAPRSLPAATVPIRYPPRSHHAGRASSGTGAGIP